MADKIAYLARYIEDALRLHILTEGQLNKLKEDINLITKQPFSAINNGTVVNYFISDVAINSSLETGICLSDEAYQVMKMIMKFNYQNIYLIDRVKIHSNYVKLILTSIFDFLMKYHEQAKKHQTNPLLELEKDRATYPLVIPGYMHWLEKYGMIEGVHRPILYQNKIIYHFSTDEKAVARSILDYLSGMSDAYILKIFNELLSF